MTEGLFLRLIQWQPKLSGVGAVILDEFHERNLASDLSLALTKRLQERAREDLRLIVMSATLDTKLVADYLSAPTLDAHGRAYPVDIGYLDKRPIKKQVVGKLRFSGSSNVPVWELAAEAAGDVLDEHDSGDILIFMPGAYEIRRTLELQRLDLAEAMLQLHAMEVGDVREFPWLQPPTVASVEQAERTLVMLRAISTDAKSISAGGRQMALLPMHPRLSQMLLEAA